MDVDDDDEYMNAAAAHAAFIMTVSSASMYWLVRHAQHVRDINIHKLHPVPGKIGLVALPIFLHSGTGYIENSRVRSMIDFFADFSQNFSETSTAPSEKSNHDFNHDFLHSGTPLLLSINLQLPHAVNCTRFCFWRRRLVLFGRVKRFALCYRTVVLSCL